MEIACTFEESENEAIFIICIISRRRCETFGVGFVEFFVHTTSM